MIRVNVNLADLIVRADAELQPQLVGARNLLQGGRLQPKFARRPSRNRFAKPDRESNFVVALTCCRIDLRISGRYLQRIDDLRGDRRPLVFGWTIGVCRALGRRVHDDQTAISEEQVQRERRRVRGMCPRASRLRHRREHCEARDHRNEVPPPHHLTPFRRRSSSLLAMIAMASTGTSIAS